MNPSNGSAPFISISNVTMKFGGSTALHALDWEVFPAEVHCLMGENGSGKSTTIKVLAGIHRPEPGAVLEIDGKRHARLTPALSKALGIQVIYQDLALFPNLSVAENIALEAALGSCVRRIRPAEQSKTARSVMQALGVTLPLETRVGDLPIATRQLVAICRGMASHARLLIMDEPTASLTRTEVNALLTVVRRLKQDGVAVVFVSHKLDEVIEIAERVTVLRDGRKRGTWPARELDDRKLGELMTGLRIEHAVHARQFPDTQPLLQVKGLSRKGEYRDLSFDVKPGEIVGLLGLLGAGRTELALTLFGMRAPDAGELLFNGKVLRVRSNAQAIAAGIAYVPEDRLGIGLNMRQSVQDNMVLAVLGRMSNRWGWLPPRRRTDMAADWCERLRIRIPSLDAPVQQLSGGNAQRVVLAKWLATEPRLLILDAPTAGVDIGNKQGIYEIVHALAHRGVAVLMISDEVPEVFFHCDRVLHMRAGRLVGQFVPGVHTESEIRERVYA
ncbi:sugar ABC transporter ATP-binding protein [Verminephrobacter aporrectodeae]|uniref:sugar ABC transporter ATP-binding protein n=1 Tax=Verminephrobacter aporrectodeae TaxID=1110389 RepID=UPI002243EA75|nr:sugar ABC transporter ATP-binding protein [Verminephrobacter aporrectodeae]